MGALLHRAWLCHSKHMSCSVTFVSSFFSPCEPTCLWGTSWGSRGSWLYHSTHQWSNFRNLLILKMGKSFSCHYPSPPHLGGLAMALNLAERRVHCWALSALWVLVGGILHPTRKSEALHLVGNCSATSGASVHLVTGTSRRTYGNYLRYRGRKIFPVFSYF